MSFFDKVFDGVAWIKIFLSPALAGFIIGLCFWFYGETNLFKIVAVSVFVAGIVGGIYLAERIRKKIGTLEFLSGADGKSELEEGKESKINPDNAVNFQEIKKQIKDQIKLQNNTTILENAEQLQIEKIQNGVLTIWVTWSPGYLNCINAIEHLHSKNYQGQIIIIDNDSIPPDFQIKTFGSVKLRGWGELFLIKNGRIIKEFTGKNSSVEFKTHFDGVVY